MVFNDGLRLRQQAREAGEEYVSEGDLSKRIITQAKGTPERAWLGGVSAVVLQQALADLNTAYRDFFASITGKRKGRKVAPPRFRSRKDNRQAIRFTRNSRFKVLDNGRLPKIGDLPVRWSRSLPAEATSVTVILDAAGRYFASFVVQTAQDEMLSPVDAEIGIDMGLTHFAVMSDGAKVTAPKFLRRAARKLKRLQQALARKQRGSQHRKKAVVKVARAHARVADNRRDWQHKLSTTLIRDNQAVHVEDDRDHNAAKNVLAAGQADNRNDRGAQVRPAAMPAPRGEAVTHPGVACSTRSVEGISVLKLGRRGCQRSRVHQW